MSPRLHWRRWLAFYLILLVASNAVRWLSDQRADTAADADYTYASVALAGDTPVRIAYQDSGPRDAPVVVLLHGSPSRGGFDQFAPALVTEHRVLVPHLPGFGASARRADNYSVRAHARYVVALLDHLQIGSAHVVGYSMGGGVALQMYAQAPDRVRSLALVSSIGVQELEMFGDYHVNRAVHALQLGVFLALEWGTPHFGWLDRTILNSRYARNFYDTDQRLLRALMPTIEVPVLILHGRDDTLIPVNAAREHQRIIPHSELQIIDGGHGLVFAQPDMLGGRVADFVGRVEDGSAVYAAQATPERLTRARAPFGEFHNAALTGLALALTLLAIVLATFISEDATCIAGGLMVAAGVAGFVPVTLACLCGIYLGDAALFFAGRHLGAPALRRAPLKWLLRSDGVAAAQAWFARRGPQAILISRFVPGTRFATYVSAGALGSSFWRFSGWFLLAAVLWTPALVALSAWLGQAIWGWFGRFSELALPALLLSALAVYLTVRVVLPLMTYRGRRLLLGRWRRLTRWEFWPRWAFYPPLVLYILYLGLRFRSPTLFTAANPAIPDGGFVGESKWQILQGLADAGGFVARTQRLKPQRPEARVDAVVRFMTQHALTFPVVLKPDIGERGLDVCIARDHAAVVEYLAVHSEVLLVQAFAPGHEFGIFYVREPDQERGRIFAITDKQPPGVTGDGQRTLETLILADERAVCMAPTFLDRHAARLFDVPAAGETVVLVDIGTHSKGCKFVDGAWLRTAQLERKIDQISRMYEGFYFGRYDIRTPDVAALQRGENFKIVELNGVTSEATNIYDPANSLWQAYRTLARQWRIAFDIGAQNRRRGVPVTPALTLLRRLVAPGTRA